MSGNSKADYEPIPDVETGESLVTPVDSRLRYPEANDQQVELLEILDSCIANPHVNLSLPEVTPQAVSTFGPDFLNSLIYPSIAATLILVSFFATSISTSTLTILASILIFASIVPATRKRLASSAETALGAIKDTKELAGSTFDDAKRRFDEIVDKVQNKLEKIISPMLPTLNKASQLEKQLQKVNPDIDIPTTDDIQDELAEAKEKFGTSLHKVLEVVHIDHFIPNYLASSSAFERQVTLPLLVVSFFLQVLGTYLVWVISAAGRNSNNNKTLAPVIAPYVFSVLQLTAIFYFTSTVFLGSQVHNIRSKANADLQKSLGEHGADRAYQEALGDRMSRIREKLLKLIQKFNKVAPMLETLSHSIENAVDLLSDETKEAAAAAMEVATDSATQVASTLNRMGSWGVGSIFGSKK